MMNKFVFFQPAVLNIFQVKVKIQVHQKVNVLCYLRIHSMYFKGMVT